MKLSDLWQSINSVLVKVGITGDLQYFFPQGGTNLPQFKGF